MKEFSIEEKAKAYDEALERAEKALEVLGTDKCEGARQIFSLFPELRESEDERVRKELITLIQGYEKGCYVSISPSKIKEFTTWLEKQGKTYTKKDVDDAWLKGMCDAKNELEKQYEANYQIRKDIATFIFNYRGDIKDRAKWMDYLGFKFSMVGEQGEDEPADKVEPKFYKGEWLCENEPNNYARFIQVLKAVNVQGKERYRISRDIHNDEDIVEFDFVEKYYHKFDIKDAKDGDVLAFYSEYKGNKMMQVGIVKEYVGKHGGCYNTFSIYVGVDWESNLQIGKHMGCSDIQPATKEQCDSLMKAMTDAGYTFDFDKKELKKIDARENLTLDGDLMEADCMVVEEKPAWSEEDERKIQDCIDAVSHVNLFKVYYQNELVEWLKSIKERIGG